AGFAVVLRAVLMNMSGPLAQAFSMEVLDARERATMVGIETAAGSLLRAGATVLGGFWMAAGSYQAPFLLTGGCFVAATGLFWLFFRHAEPAPVPAPARRPPEAGTPALGAAAGAARPAP